MAKIVVLLSMGDDMQNAVHELARRLNVSPYSLFERYLTREMKRGLKRIVEENAKLDIASAARTGVAMPIIEHDNEEEADG